jgi:hypothetical protein
MDVELFSPAEGHINAFCRLFILDLNKSFRKASQG